MSRWSFYSSLILVIVSFIIARVVVRFFPDYTIVLLWLSIIALIVCLIYFVMIVRMLWRMNNQ